MLSGTPNWSLQREHAASAWPDRVRLVGSVVVGQWYALNRADGSAVWERDLPGANYITGIHGDTLLCANIAPGWRSGRGAAALQLSDGQILWCAELSPLSLEGEEFRCMDGSIRDLRSGALLRHEPPPARFYGHDAPDSLRWNLALTTCGGAPVRLADNVLVSRSAPDRSVYCGTSLDRAPLWRFSPAESGWACGESRADLFVRPPYIFLLASRSRPYEYLDVNMIKYVPTRRHLLVLDVRTGELAQVLDLGIWCGPCSIDDIDSTGILFSLADSHLAHYTHRFG